MATKISKDSSENLIVLFRNALKYKVENRHRHTSKLRHRERCNVIEYHVLSLLLAWA